MKKIHRFITEYQKTKDILKITNLAFIHQIKDVLKMKIGENCIIIGSDQKEIMSTIKNIQKQYIELEINKIEQNKKIKDQNIENKNVTLYMAILKKENFELVVQKASEIGITKIVPIITDRTVKTGLRYDRLEKIAREASELSGRNSVTIIDEIKSFKNAIQSDTNETKIIFDITGSKIYLIDKETKTKKLKPKSISLYIGPEGGFTDQELKLAKDLPIISLGNLTLRAETASIIASYLAMQS